MDVRRFYVFAAIWGLVAAAVAILALHNGRSPGLVVASAFVELVAAAIVFLAGRQAKQAGGHPWRVGAITGIIFALFAGWASFAVHITRQELLTRLHGHLPSTAPMSVVLRAANSPAAHVVTWVGTLLEGVILGLILGWVGGMTARSPSANQDV